MQASMGKRENILIFPLEWLLDAGAQHFPPAPVCSFPKQLETLKYVHKEGAVDPAGLSMAISKDLVNAS